MKVPGPLGRGDEHLALAAGDLAPVEGEGHRLDRLGSAWSTRSAARLPGGAAGGRPAQLIGAAPVLDVHEELVAEHLDGRSDGRRDGRPEHADGGLLGRPGQPGGDVVAGVEEQVEVLLAAVTGLDALHDPLEPARPLAARRALAARLPEEELGDAPGRPHRTGVVVHDHDRARAEHGAGRGHLVLAEREVDLVGTEPRGRDPTGDEGLEAPAVRECRRPAPGR